MTVECGCESPNPRISPPQPEPTYSYIAKSYCQTTLCRHHQCKEREREVFGHGSQVREKIRKRGRGRRKI